MTRDVRWAAGSKFIRLAPGATLATACGATLGDSEAFTRTGAALYRALIGETVAVGRGGGRGAPRPTPSTPPSP